MDDKRLKRIFLVTISALCLAALIAFIQVRIETTNAARTDVVAEDFGGPFTLTDHTGKKVTEKDYNGQWRLMYFGFTFCPAICPTELAKMTKALNAVGDKANKITPLFITIDPERDTVDVMKGYVASFHPRLIGLTGTAEQIKKVAKEYKIYYAKVDDPAMTEYTMDHSSFIYFIDPDNNLRAIIRAGDDAGVLAEAINKAID